VGVGTLSKYLSFSIEWTTDDPRVLRRKSDRGKSESQKRKLILSAGGIRLRDTTALEIGDKDY